MGRVSGSSLVLAVGFSRGPGEAGTLRIKFPDATIDFDRVPYAVYRGLVMSKDKSHYYLRAIYGNFKYNKF
jgi:hypothetical protein